MHRSCPLALQAGIRRHQELGPLANTQSRLAAEWGWKPGLVTQNMAVLPICCLLHRRKPKLERLSELPVVTEISSDGSTAPVYKAHIYGVFCMRQALFSMLRVPHTIYSSLLP